MIKGILTSSLLTILLLNLSCCSSLGCLEQDSEMRQMYEPPVSKLTEQVLPKIENIVTLVCDVAGKAINSDVTLKSDLLKNWAKNDIQNLHKCVENGNHEIVLTMNSNYPLITIRVISENNDLLLDIGIINAPRAGRGTIYYLEKEGEFYKISGIKTEWKS
ncbi:MAG: hypothetical protein GY839_01150 [candidate division Zixibacteria bacterium]|nr:hypothetical protein [candidate division Zixibacteria bacterium]